MLICWAAIAASSMRSQSGPRRQRSSFERAALEKERRDATTPALGGLGKEDTSASKKEPERSVSAVLGRGTPRPDSSAREMPSARTVLRMERRLERMAERSFSSSALTAIMRLGPVRGGSVRVLSWRTKLGEGVESRGWGVREESRGCGGGSECGSMGRSVWEDE